MNKSTRKRRVLFLFAHLHKGGMQKAVSNISLALPGDFEQHVGYFGTENPGFIYSAKLHDFQLPANNAGGILRKISNALRRIVAIRRYVRVEEIDIVVSFGETANLYSLASGHGAKKIITSRVALVESPSGVGIYRLAHHALVNYLYPKADAAVGVSESLAKDLQSITRGHVPVSAIPNLYHVEEIQRLSKEPLPLQFSHLNDKKFILNVGSLCYQKAQDDLLKIFKRVYAERTDILLVMLGRGEWHGWLRKQAESMGISDVVIFIDFDLNPYKYMARAQIFLLTSRYEGFPNVIVEAMICSAPIVAFDCPTGPEEILGTDSSYGILVKDRSIDDAAKGIGRLLDEPIAMQYARALSNKRGAFYSASTIVDKWIDVLK